MRTGSLRQRLRVHGEPAKEFPSTRRFKPAHVWPRHRSIRLNLWRNLRQANTHFICARRGPVRRMRSYTPSQLSELEILRPADIAHELAMKCRRAQIRDLWAGYRRASKRCLLSENCTAFRVFRPFRSLRPDGHLHVGDDILRAQGREPVVEGQAVITRRKLGNWAASSSWKTAR